MEEQLEIENKVLNSGLITFDLENLYHSGERIPFDIKPLLYREMIVKEKDFREYIKTHDWSQYQGKNIAFICTSDALVPTWAYMLLAKAIQPYANRYVFGDLQLLESILFYDAISKINMEEFKDKRVIVKGCSDKNVPVSAYVEITNKLLPLVKSIMYGEACSNVPIFKRTN
ncbi:MAG: DUF2480 family protein [Bacteroidetes bacterium]|nr:DUF2480 family protein [Bacteroidota bacterium]